MWPKGKSRSGTSCLVVSAELCVVSAGLSVAEREIEVGHKLPGGVSWAVCGISWAECGIGWAECGRKRD